MDGSGPRLLGAPDSEIPEAQEAIVEDDEPENALATADGRYATPQPCYVCKRFYYARHHFYDCLCPRCAELNWQVLPSISSIRFFHLRNKKKKQNEMQPLNESAHSALMARSIVLVQNRRKSDPHALCRHKRTREVSLAGKCVLVTGGRIKIGFQAALKLLRAGATVHVTTRFPQVPPSSAYPRSLTVAMATGCGASLRNRA